jgi:hypothetical protein
VRSVPCAVARISGPRHAQCAPRGGLVNQAVTLADSVRVTVQAPVPVHAPLQPEKMEPISGDGVSVTLVPLGKLSRQSRPQTMPAGVEVTEPEPRPFVDTFNVDGLPSAAKFAVAVFARVIVTAHVVAVPLQSPLQPMKTEPLGGVAVRVTFVL